jgi:HEAT repeat protein
MLRDRDASVRLEAIREMAARPWRSAPPKALGEALEDESPEIRKEAVSSMTSYHGGLDPWIPTLLRIAESDPDQGVRARCRMGLFRPFEPLLITRAAVTGLIEGLKSKDAAIRILAAGLLGGGGEDAREAVPDLLRALSAPRTPGEPRLLASTDELACKAAEALARIAPGTADAKRVVAALTEFVQTDSYARRSAAAQALGAFGPEAESAVPALAAILEGVQEGVWFDREHAVVRALAAIAPGTPSAGRAVAALLPGLRSSSQFSRLRAVEMLAPFAVDSAEAADAIRSMKDDPDVLVRQAVEKARGAIGDGDAP